MARIKMLLTISSATVLAFLAVRLADYLASAPAVHAGADTPTHQEAMTRLDADVSAWRARLHQYPNSWIEHERVANVYVLRARASGDWSDYAIADSLIAQAFEIARPGAGPFLSRARLNFTLHRFDRVEADLARAESIPLTSSHVHGEIAALRADLALETGRIDEAIAAYQSMVGDARDLESVIRLAGGYTRRGRPDDADRLYEEVSRRLPASAARLRAWVNLQRGLLDLDTNRLDEALAHFRDADAALPGWWLIDEHIAEATARLGQTERALAMYMDILSRHEDPEFMDAVARIYRQRGNAAEAAKWIAKAKAGHAARLSMFPEAAAGHAQAHIEDFGAI